MNTRLVHKSLATEGCASTAVCHWLKVTADFLCLSLKGLELLYQPEVVRLYLALLTCSHNHNTLEAAAGALQNLAAGQWAVSENSDFYNVWLIHSYTMQVADYLFC